MSSTIKFPNKFPILETERLNLVAQKLSDANEFYELRSNPQFMKYMAQFPMTTLSEAENFIAKTIHAFQNKEGISWKISIKGETKLIGYTGFWRIDFENTEGEIGFGLHPDQQGKGYMKEANEAIINYGLNNLGLKSVIADIDPENTASANNLKNVGFEKSAYLKNSYQHNGKSYDSEIYRLIPGA